MNFSVQATKEKTCLGSSRALGGWRHADGAQGGHGGPSGEGLHSGLEVDRSGPGRMQHMGRPPGSQGEPRGR